MAPGADCGDCQRRPRARSPTRVIGTSARCPHQRALYPPRGANNPLMMSTTPSRRRQRAPTSQASPNPPPASMTMAVLPSAGNRPQGRASRGRPARASQAPEDCSGSSATPSEHAHKDPDLRNTNRTQGRNQALVCDSVLPNSLPCVRHQRTRTLKKDETKDEPTNSQRTKPTKQRTGGPADRTADPRRNRRNQTSKPANPRTKGRLTTQERPHRPEPRPHRPGSRTRGRPHRPGSRARGRHRRPHPLAGTPGPSSGWGPPAPPGEPRPQRRPTAVASRRGAGRRRRL